MEFEYRRMNTADPVEILSIAERDILIPTLFDPDLQPTPTMLSDRVESLGKMRSEDFAYVAVDSSGHVVGFHLIRKDTFFGRPVGNVSTLWVDPDHRRKGVAKNLKLRAERWGREQGLYCLYTHTFARNEPTVDLNKKLGFEIISYRLQKKL